MTAPAVTDGPDPFTHVYAEHFGFLADVATYKFKVPPDAAEDLVQEVFLTYLLVQHRVVSPRAWLIGGVCNASRRYWMTYHRRAEEDLSVAPDEGTDYEAFMCEVSVRHVINRLQPRCRDTLSLHYWHGATAREVARSLGTTHKYAEKLIHKCLRKAFDAWHELWSNA